MNNTYKILMTIIILTALSGILYVSYRFATKQYLPGRSTTCTTTNSDSCPEGFRCNPISPPHILEAQENFKPVTGIVGFCVRK
ncbi:MAG: hypothetical protein ACPGO5_05300 [Patescibacteria group bacterium]